MVWELPPRVQLGLAVAMAERHLPEYERKHPHLPQLGRFLGRCLTVDPPTDDDVGEWYGALSDKDRGDLADRALFGAAELAVDAAREIQEPSVLTSACMLSVVDAIGACEDEAWMAVDAEAAAARLSDLLRDDEEEAPPLFHPLKFRGPWHHSRVRSAAFAGWDAAVAWLRTADVGQYPDPVDRGGLARLLREIKKLPRVIYPPHRTNTRI